jgi:hypothetical protein
VLDDSGGVNLNGFRAFLEAKPDRLFPVPAGQATHFDTLIEQNDQTLRLNCRQSSWSSSKVRVSATHEARMPSDDWTARTEASTTRCAHARRRAARTTRVPADMTVRDAAAADLRDARDYRDLINKRTARGPQYCGVCPRGIRQVFGWVRCEQHATSARCLPPGIPQIHP